MLCLYFFRRTIDTASYSHTVNAATMKKDIDRNKPHWEKKTTPAAFRLSEVNGL